ncbi:MAG: hypothetical protein KDD99_17035 [Bacteroidetes bacterium]|nr:hypothetical protein [Bacteroidota bacterium]
MKSNLLTFFFLLSALSLFSQTGLLLNWEKEIINDKGPAVVELINVKAVSGGAVVVGNSSTEEGVRMYIAKYDQSGNLSWDLTLPSVKSSSLNRVEVSNQGDLYVAGRELVDNVADPEIHFAKISSNGQLVWHKTYNGPENLSDGLSDFVLANNHLYMSGLEEDSQNFQHGWVAKFNLSGNLVWDKAFSPGVYVWLGSLAVDQAGNVSVVGSADDDYSFLAIQYDDAGNLNWQYPDTLTGGSEKWLTDVKIDDWGNVYVIGTEETGAFFQYDIITMKLGPNGKLRWKKNFSNGGENGGSILQIGSDGNIYSFGYKEDNFDEFAQILVYDTSGQTLWDTDYTIDNNTYIAGAELDANDNIYLAVQDFDSMGFAVFSSSGNLMAAKNYGQEAVDYLSGFDLSGTTLFSTAYSYNASRSQLFSLQKNNLNENFVAEGMGLALSDVKPGAIITDGNSLWFSSYSDDGDSASFSITKMNLN